jgi:secondary thiamine-phosphate synthase enzyme
LYEPVRKIFKIIFLDLKFKKFYNSTMATLKRISIKTKGFTDVIDITDKVAELVEKYSLSDTGLVNIFCPGSTGALTTIEYEPGLISDIKKYLEKFLPYKENYQHHLTWHDDNGAAHLRSAFIGPSLVIPFENKKLQLGTWQQIIFIDFDTRPRNRNLIVTII